MKKILLGAFLIVLSYNVMGQALRVVSGVIDRPYSTANRTGVRFTSGSITLDINGTSILAFPSGGGFNMGTGTFTASAGVINAQTGFRINNTATTGNYLRGNGTNLILSALLPSDLSQSGATSGQVLGWDGSTWLPVSNTSESTKIGAFTNTATNQGLVISGDSIKMTAADITHPGGINLTGQVLSAGTQQKTISADNGIQLRLDDPLATKSAGLQFSESTGANIMAQMTATSPDADNGNVQLKVEDTGALETYIEVGAQNDRKGIFEKGGLYEDPPKVVTTATYTLQYGDRNLLLDATDMVLTLQEIGTDPGQTKPGRVAYFFNDNTTSTTLTGGGGQDIIDANTLSLSGNSGVTLIATASGKWIIKG